jgi:hypothetical protein
MSKDPEYEWVKMWQGRVEGSPGGIHDNRAEFELGTFEREV